MADMMTFPDTWEEFEELYHITDTEQIYTNGSRLIPSFRVEQWLEHIADRNSSEKPNNCETCLYRSAPWDAPICDSCTMADSHYEKDEFAPKTEPQRCYLRKSCDHYGDKQVCGRCREYNLYSHTKTEPQTDCAWGKGEEQ